MKISQETDLYRIVFYSQQLKPVICSCWPVSARPWNESHTNTLHGPLDGGNQVPHQTAGQTEQVSSGSSFGPGTGLSALHERRRCGEMGQVSLSAKK